MDTWFQAMHVFNNSYDKVVAQLKLNVVEVALNENLKLTKGAPMRTYSLPVWMGTPPER